MFYQSVAVYGLDQCQRNCISLAVPNVTIDSIQDPSEFLTCTAATIVYGRKQMNEAELSALVKIHQRNADCCFVLLYDIPQIPFMYILETNRDTMTDTITTILEQLALPAQLLSAQQYAKNTLNAVCKDLTANPERPLRSQIGFLESRSLLYDRLNALVQHNQELGVRAKYPYLVELNSLLMAALKAHGLIDLDESGDFEEGSFYDRDWIDSLAGLLSQHYLSSVRKNGGK